MTNYNERLEEIVEYCDFECDSESDVCKWCGLLRQNPIHTAIADLTQLFRDMVKEAKPSEFTSHFDPRLGAAERVVGRFANTREEQLYGYGNNAGADKFESNLLKALEEV